MGAIDEIRAIVAAERLAAQSSASLPEFIPDPCARMGVTRTAGGPLPVPVELFVAKSNTFKENGERVTITYSKAVEGPVDSAAWSAARVGIVGKGTPAPSKRMAYPRTYGGKGTALGNAKQTITVERPRCQHGCSSSEHVPAMGKLIQLDRDWMRMVDPLNDPAPDWVRILMGPYWMPPERRPVVKITHLTMEQKEARRQQAREEARRKMAR